MKLMIFDETSKIKYILCKPGEKRSFNELCILSKLFIHTVPAGTKKEALLNLAKFMQLESYKSKQTIVEQGTSGDKYFMVLEGTVQIFSKTVSNITGNIIYRHVADLGPN